MNNKVGEHITLDFHGVHEGIEISRNNAINEEEYNTLLEAKKDLC